VFKIKRNEKGQILKYRARLVAKGFKQIAGQDFSEVFAPVSKHATFRMLLSIVASNDLELHHIDVKTAFMNGELQEEIYMQPPPGWEGTSSMAWRLHKGVNGLKQAARAWNEKLTATVQKLGFNPSNSDVSLYISGTPPNACYLLCYVDDILIAGSMSKVESVKRQIAEIFKCDDMGQASLFLGMKIIRNRAQRKLWVGQSHYVLEILERAGLKDCRPRKTPLDANLTLSKDAGEPAPDSLDEYQELVGCLLYLTGCTRPDIAQSVGVLSRFMSAPTNVHMSSVKQVIRYLAGTVHLGLEFSEGKNEIVGYCDADYAGDIDKRKSTSGYVFLMNGASISWSSKLQPTVAMSTCEAEFVAAANAAKEVLWLASLLGDFTGKVKPVKLFVDNQGALKLIHHPHAHQKTKHIDIAYRFIQDRAERGEIICEYIETAKMVADCTTKAVPLAKLQENIRDMGLVSKVQDQDKTKTS
jgi:Reverse transcriptase (RNA-dependent DNA polymerase)